MAKFWDWVNKQANKQPTTGDELLYADALKNQEARNAANNQYAAAAAAAKSGSANSSSLQGTIDPDRTGAAAPPRKGLYDQTGMNATAANAASGAITGAMAGAGRLPKPDGAQQPTTTPTQPGTSGGGKVTYIDPNGDAQTDTTGGTPEDKAGVQRRTYPDALREQ